MAENGHFHCHQSISTLISQLLNSTCERAHWSFFVNVKSTIWNGLNRNSNRISCIIVGCCSFFALSLIFFAFDLWNYYWQIVDGNAKTDVSNRREPGMFCGEAEQPQTFISETSYVKIIFFAENYTDQVSKINVDINLIRSIE